MEILIACGVFFSLGTIVALVLTVAAKCFSDKKALSAAHENLVPEKGESTSSDV